MIFQELNKLKRQTIMSAIVLIVIGILMIICPESYVTTMIGAFGSVMIVLAVLGVFDFISSNKAFIHYVYLTGKLILGVIGVAILLFEADSLFIISWLFGINETVKNIILAVFACVIFFGSCIMCMTDIQPRTSDGMPVVAVVGFIFSIALGIYTIKKMTQKR